MVVEFPAACPQTQKKRRKENRKTKDFLKEVSMGVVDSILGCVSTNTGKKIKEKRGKTRDSGGSQHRRR